ncbi:hypothetical protein ABMY26_17515 [Azospirillum sp. HJ39]|uniref:hypothetical protein n=1 Tax=Azospirillum sp. HJ39 TaxID=3159496 RepID=UPI0035565B51
MTALAGGLVLAALAADAAHAAGGASLQLSGQAGSQVGMLCQFLDPERNPPPPEAGDLCEAAAEWLEHRTAAAGKTVVRLGLRDATGTDGQAPEGPSVDGPILLLVIEGRPGWNGAGTGRLTLRARPVYGNASAAVVGLPARPVSLGRPDWLGPARDVLAGVLDFAVRD